MSGNEGEGLTPEDLRCPSCGYRVYGLPDARCPECGRRFDWKEAYDPQRTRRGMLFEDRWRAHPLDALGRTWGLAALRPRRLWAAYTPSAAPRVIPLLVFAALQWLVFTRGWHTVAWVVDPLMNWLAGLRAAGGLPRWRFTYTFRPDLDFFPHTALWCVATFLVLQMFFESKARYGIRWRHCLRVFVYSTALAALCPAIWCVLEAILDATLFLRQPGRFAAVGMAGLYERLGQGVFILGVLSVWAYLWIGYRSYLRTPHGWAVAALSMFTGWLIATLVMVCWY